jgi:glycosyltransferase involved in cell wall biosynthesis
MRSAQVGEAAGTYPCAVSATAHKLLFVINRLLPAGGAEVQLVHLATGLAEEGHEVTVCCVDTSLIDPKVLEAAGVRLIALGARGRLARIAAIPKLVRLARQVDVVQCTMWDASLWGRIAAILARRPVVVADHQTDRRAQVSASGAPRGRWIAFHNRVLDPFTAATVACADSQFEVLTGEGVARKKIVHIPNGVPIAALEAQAASADRAALGLPVGVPLVLQVGVFRKEKNQIGALEAFVSVRGKVPDAVLVFAGVGKLRESVERRAAELGAEDWALFLGNREDVPSLLTVADLMILPSLADAMPMTVLEAMALGTPIVASAVGDIPAMLNDRAGVCVPPGDVTALADEIAAVLTDEPRRRTLAEAGKEIARSFDSAAMTKRYETVFDAAIDGRPPTLAATKE